MTMTLSLCVTGQAEVRGDAAEDRAGEPTRGVAGCAEVAVGEATTAKPPACGAATAGGKGVDASKRLSGRDLDDGAAAPACSRSAFRPGALGRSKVRPASKPTPKTSSGNATGNILRRLRGI